MPPAGWHPADSRGCGSSAPRALVLAQSLRRAAVHRLSTNPSPPEPSRFLAAASPPAGFPEPDAVSEMCCLDRSLVPARAASRLPDPCPTGDPCLPVVPTRPRDPRALPPPPVNIRASPEPTARRAETSVPRLLDLCAPAALLRQDTHPRPSAHPFHAAG